MTDIEGTEDERRQRAIAANQTIFREINENLEKVNDRFRQIIPVGDFVCECANVECTARIGLTIAEYEELRSVPTHFAVRNGHVFPEAERVIEENVGYMVVEKFGVAADYAKTHDPRAG
jgi:hypothetical protein